MMPLTDNELKAVMMADAECIVSRLVAERKHGAEVTLAHIEQAVLAAGQHFQQALTGRLMEVGGAERSPSRPLCPGCGAALHSRGSRDRRVVTETGDVQIRRAYFYCPTCRKGIFPPG